MGHPFQKRNLEHMALWMIERLIGMLGRAMRRGLSLKIQSYVAQHEVMVKLCRLCVERIEQRGEV